MKVTIYSIEGGHNNKLLFIILLHSQGTGRGGNLEKLIPLFIFGALSLVAGFSAYFLPETKNRRLPETIEDAVAFGR